jgi:cytochrome oxidase Cu insertion factor (SCO1/SenC/PrrC family)
MGGKATEAATKSFMKNGTDKFGKSAANSIFDFTLKDIDGKPFNLADLKGKKKAFLLTNVACDCGYTG